MGGLRDWWQGTPEAVEGDTYEGKNFSEGHLANGGFPVLSKASTSNWETGFGSS